MRVVLTRLLGRGGVIVALLAFGSGCGTGYSDPYATGAYGAYGNGYGSTSGGYGSSYGSDYGGSYGGLTGGDYGYGAGTGYGASPTPYGGAGTYGEYGSSYGDDRVVRATPSPSRPPQVLPVGYTPPVLNVWVLELRRSGVLGFGRSVAKVEVSNPGDRVAEGLVRVTFKTRAKPVGQIQSERVSLQAKERRVLTFSVDAWGVDDAEATVLTETPATTPGRVLDRPTGGASR